MAQVQSICEDILSLDECPSVASLQGANQLLAAENDNLRSEVERLTKSRGGRPKTMTPEQRREHMRVYMRKYRRDRKAELAELRAKVNGGGENDGKGV